MKLFILALVLLTVLALSGCKKPPAYVGTYKLVLTSQMQSAVDQLSKRSQTSGTGIDPGAAFAGSTITLNADGTVDIGNTPAGSGYCAFR